MLSVYHVESRECGICEASAARGIEVLNDVFGGPPEEIERIVVAFSLEVIVWVRDNKK